MITYFILEHTSGHVIAWEDLDVLPIKGWSIRVTRESNDVQIYTIITDPVFNIRILEGKTTTSVELVVHHENQRREISK